jgi:hypothetical protein
MLFVMEVKRDRLETWLGVTCVAALVREGDLERRSRSTANVAEGWKLAAFESPLRFSRLEYFIGIAAFYPRSTR